MRYQTAHGIALVALWKDRPFLEKILGSRFTLDEQRFFLSAIRDRLQQACNQFETEIGVEGIFLPLNQSVWLLTDALAKSPVDAEPVRAALARLDDLDELLKLVPADHFERTMSCS